MAFDRKEYYQRTKEIQKQRVAEWRKNNKDQHKETSLKSARSRRARDPVAFLYGRTRDRAKQNGVDFNLELSDIVIPETCPILGIPLFFSEWTGNSGIKNPNAPSIDRKDSTKGYVKGNVLVCSWRANCLKSDGSLDEFKRLVDFMTNQLILDANSSNVDK